jgi:regulatory protein
VLQVESGYQKREEREARAYALRLLTRRTYSSVELMDKLQRKGYPSVICQNTIAFLQGIGYLNDCELAQREAIRCLERCLGPKRVRLRLRQRGLPDDLMAGISEYEFREACLAAAKKRLRTLPANLDPLRMRAKLCYYLERRGFSWDDIGWVLKELSIET